MKSHLFTAMAVAIAAGVFITSLCGTSIARAADHGRTDVIKVPAGSTSAVSGKQMYGSYCAACHGVNGKGNGPLATTLKSHPTDLTILSKNNGGKYPSTHITAVIQFGAEVPAHGTSTMPVWGPILAKMDKANTPQRALRISNLNHYVETMQAR